MKKIALFFLLMTMLTTVISAQAVVFATVSASAVGMVADENGVIDLTHFFTTKQGGTEYEPIAVNIGQKYFCGDIGTASSYFTFDLIESSTVSIYLKHHKQSISGATFPVHLYDTYGSEVAHMTVAYQSGSDGLLTAYLERGRYKLLIGVDIYNIWQRDNYNFSICSDNMHAGPFVQSTVDADCSAEGLITTYCTTCNGPASVTPLPSLSHDYAVDSFPATCTEYGYETMMCNRCGYISETIQLPPTGQHVPGDDTSFSATCEHGSGYICSICGAEVITSDDVLGHDLVWNTKIPANCFTKATDELICTNCGNVFDQRTSGEITAHTPGEWTIIYHCGEDADKVLLCANCGSVLASQKVFGSVRMHSFTDWSTDFSGANEYRMSRTCIYCGYLDTVLISK